MKIMLCDGNNLLMRSVHAMYGTRLSSAEGVPTGPLMNFINSLVSFTNQWNPDSLAICWDGGASERRLILSADYKSNRNTPEGDFGQWKNESFVLARAFCQYSGIPQYREAGIEADDLIAWFCRHNPDHEIMIVSNDKDFLQLVGPKVQQHRPSSSHTVNDVWDEERVKQEMGVIPEHMPWYLALVGDTVDAVPGVPGVGPKRAAKIINEAQGDPDLILSHERVRDHREQALIALQQVDLRTEYESLAIEKTPGLFQPQTGPALIDFLDWLDLEQLKARALTGALWMDLDS